MKKILIAGGSGVIGRALTDYMTTLGYQVKSLTRNKIKAREEDYLHWDPKEHTCTLEGFLPDYVINLSGAGIADKKWSKKRKEIIIKSRTESTQFLIAHLNAAGIKLDAFISASAIGYYGDTADTLVSEENKPITSEFISKVCQQWEEAALPAKQITKSLSILRISTVLSKESGALEKMDKTIQLGMANYLGNGKQYFAWIHINDLCGIINHCLQSTDSYQVYNAAAPHEVTNYQFTKVLRDTINPKALLLPAPSLSIKLLFGEMSRVVLNSSRVDSSKIVGSGYEFYYPKLEDALADIYS